MRKQRLVSFLHLLMTLLALAAVAEPPSLANSTDRADELQRWRDTINQLEQESETFSIEIVESLKSYAAVLAKAGQLKILFFLLAYILEPSFPEVTVV